VLALLPFYRGLSTGRVTDDVPRWTMGYFQDCAVIAGFFFFGALNSSFASLAVQRSGLRLQMNLSFKTLGLLLVHCRSSQGHGGILSCYNEHSPTQLPTSNNDKL
jgi:hypothetical protein